MILSIEGRRSAGAMILSTYCLVTRVPQQVARQEPTLSYLPLLTNLVHSWLRHFVWCGWPQDGISNSSLGSLIFFKQKVHVWILLAFFGGLIILFALAESLKFPLSSLNDLSSSFEKFYETLFCSSNSETADYFSGDGGIIFLEAGYEGGCIAGGCICNGGGCICYAGGLPGGWVGGNSA